MCDRSAIFLVSPGALLVLEREHACYHASLLGAVEYVQCLPQQRFTTSCIYF
jgi:hypothetical protein